MRKPQFKTEIVVSVFFGKILRKGDFVDIHRLISYLVGDKTVINTNLTDVSVECSVWLGKELPWLNDTKLPDNVEEYKAWLDKLVAEHGPWIPLSPNTNTSHKQRSYLYQVIKRGMLPKIIFGRIRIFYTKVINYFKS